MLIYFGRQAEDIRNGYDAAGKRNIVGKGLSDRIPEQYEDIVRNQFLGAIYLPRQEDIS